MKSSVAVSLALLLVFGAFSIVPSASGADPDWSQGVSVPADGRPNPYGLDDVELQQSVRRGRLGALQWPVSITGALIPYEILRQALEDPVSPLMSFVKRILGRTTGVRNLDDGEEWLGLHPYPAESDTGVYSVPYPDGKRPDFRMGFSLVKRHGVDGVTISCANCHSANLFGKVVLGMTNRFPRSNHAIALGKQLMGPLEPGLYGVLTHASKEERRMYAETRDSLARVEAINPVALGLDTSLAQVALSLAKRRADEYATPDAKFERKPRADALEHDRADSKPAVWWNLKYKNRWLSDGSVVAGNPIFTNFIWNEIGRGTDLRELDAWLKANPGTIQDMTAAAFSSEAPRFTDFFAAASIDPARARHGEALFGQYCARCHGTYEKAWSAANVQSLSWIEQLRTTRVLYPERTPVVDVGTDPARFLGMRSLERALNPLAISRREGILVQAQKGYVPPPLVGIWARWPYFHNNSVPSLCSVLTRASLRPREYDAGEANSPQTDFDSECNGYPLGANTPQKWREDAEKHFDTRKAGMRNAGHDEGIFLKDGKELLSDADKRDVIQFLQTL